MGRFKHGWKPDRVDPRDRLYRDTTPARLAPLPDLVDLRGSCSPIEDQGQLGACTAHALAGALEFLEKQSSNHEIPDFIKLSRLFIYYNERDIEGDVNEDNGAELRDGIKSLNDLGVCKEEIWPYDPEWFKNKPTDNCYQDAKNHQIVSYHRLLSIQDMLNCLAGGLPFVFGMQVFPSFESDDVAKSGNVPMPGPAERSIGGHAVLCVGYNNQTENFIVRNSWGPSWGAQGYFIVPYKYLELYGDDFWVILK